MLCRAERMRFLYHCFFLSLPSDRAKIVTRFKSIKDSLCGNLTALEDDLEESWGSTYSVLVSLYYYVGFDTPNLVRFSCQPYPGSIQGL